MSKKTILVTGDVCIDWNIATNRFSGHHNLWKTEGEWASSTAEGGAALLLGRIIEKTCGSVANIFSRTLTIEDHLQSDKIDHLYTAWSQHDTTQSRNGSAEEVWRIKQYLGHKPRCCQEPFSDNLNDKFYGEDADLLIIDDKRFGFRGAEKDGQEKIDKECYWPDFSKSKLIIIRMARDLCKGELWDELINKHSDKLLTVFTANDLRHADVRVSRELSWEQTILDVINALTSNKDLESTKKSKYILVSFDAAGVLIWQPEASMWTIVYTPNSMEGQAQPSDKGRINGYTYCLISALAYCIIKNGPDYDQLNPTLIKSAKIGIHAMKELYSKGFSANPPEKGDNEKPLYFSIRFPVDNVADTIKASEEYLMSRKEAIVDFELSDIKKILSPGWSILDHRKIQLLNEEDILKNILKEGLQGVLKDVPICKHGKLTVVDREEIESLHSIRNIILEYAQKRHEKNNFNAQPLSLAVFGPPGSGKSFAVKQLAKSLDLQTETLEFNLSQFSEPKEIIGAFHQIRDAVLNGKLPFVFWDEFDSKFQGNNLGWLKYFLAPMQDGKFQDRQITHSIGSCIFVFAGGTYCTFSDFMKETEKQDDDKSSKKPDFTSRLKGNLTIKGINKDTGGEHYKIRRAILLRGMLEEYAPDVWNYYDKKPNIQDKVFKAFMNIDEYKNGARSMQAIILMSRLSGEMEFTTSALPSSSQLDIHVDGENFIKLAHGAC